MVRLRTDEHASGNPAALAHRLRASAAEVAALAVSKGASAGTVAEEIGALATALERGDTKRAAEVAAGRAASDAVFDWIEAHGLSVTARELRVLHAFGLGAAEARIDALTQAQEAAARSDERLRFILSTARIVVGELDRDLRFHWIYDPEQLPEDARLGKSIREVGDPAFAEELAAIVERVIRTGIGERAELSPPPHESQQDHLLVSFEPTRDRTGTVTGVLVASTEVTELKEAQIALTQSAAFRERMLAILAHDLRNPLSSIVALTRLFARKDEVAPDVRRAFVQMEQASSRMVELIGTLLDFSAVRFGNALPIVRAPLDLHRVASDVLDELRSAAPERALDLRVHGDTQGAWDASRMAQVVSNLVGNALTHGAQHAPVLVEIAGGDRGVTLHVTNRGPVIPPTDMALLFEPFRRGTAAGQRSRGLGLGLYIVQEIVRSHDGQIRVESSLERGTVFTVELPRLGPSEARP
jgi:signal transduction histidine kinase